MKYINREDLTAYIQEMLLNSSIAGVDNISDTTILDEIEARTIDLVISYIGGRYNTSLIFADTPIRNGVIVEIVSQIVIYRVVRRNAARKVPEDFVDIYKDALKQLEKIQSGSQFLENLPTITAADGTTASLVYGSNRNSDFFI